MEKMTIGKMAKLNNVSVQTLHHYDKLNLLKPIHKSEENNYRYYDIKQCAKLDMIQNMKRLGMPLSTIFQCFENGNVSELTALLENQKKIIDEQINELNIIKNATSAHINNFERYNNAPKDNTITLQHIPKRNVFSHDSKKNIYDNNLETYEYIIRELKKQAILVNLPMVYFFNVGSIFRKEFMDKKEFHSTEIFVFLGDDFNDEFVTETIPENDFVCIYCDSFYKEIEYAERLFSYVEENNYEIVGDYICEVVTELPVFHEQERNMFLKLQIPVKKP